MSYGVYSIVPDLRELLPEWEETDEDTLKRWELLIEESTEIDFRLKKVSEAIEKLLKKKEALDRRLAEIHLELKDMYE